MDQTTLVKEQILGGRRLISRLRDDGMELVGACWAKTDTDSQWYLYLVSPPVEVAGVRPGYLKVRTAIGQLDNAGWDEFERVNPLNVKLIGLSDPLVRGLAFEYHRYAGVSPTHHHGSHLGEVSIEAAYIYPATMFTAQPQPT